MVAIDENHVVELLKSFQVEVVVHTCNTLQKRMMVRSFRKLAAAWLMMVFAFGITSPASADQPPSLGIFDSLKESYEELPPSGKFVTGVALGFTSTRFVVNKAVGFAKLAGAAFIA